MYETTQMSLLCRATFSHAMRLGHVSIRQFLREIGTSAYRSEGLSTQGLGLRSGLSAASLMIYEDGIAKATNMVIDNDITQFGGK